MAGAGYKLFTTGQVLTAAEVNTYLQEQVIMVFNDATARTTALSGVLAEGMVSYLKSTKVVEIYNGTAWASLDDPNAIQNTIVDAKGDLISASGNDVPARLAVGNNGETLIADSSTSTGLRWQGSQTAGKNALINGGFDIWQRGTSIASAGKVYGADRWIFYRFNTGAGVTLNQGSGLTGTQYAARLQRNSGQTFTDALYLEYNLESADSYRFAGKAVTFSFYVRKGANYSGGDLTAQIRSGTGTDQTLYVGYTGVNTVASTTATVNSTTAYQRVTLTGTVPSNATQVGVYIAYTPSGTAGANDYLEIGQAQLELGSVATEFSRAGGTLAGELLACMRYYCNVNYQATTRNAYNNLGNGVINSATNARIFTYLPVTMRVAPTSIDWTGPLIADDGVSAFTVTGVTINQSGSNMMFVDCAFASGGTQHRPVFLYTNGNSNARLSFNAEL